MIRFGIYTSVLGKNFACTTQSGGSGNTGGSVVIELVAAADRHQQQPLLL